jgi:hypothetical protein
MRTVDLSNSVLVITPPPDAFASKFTDTGVVIRDQLNEIIELAPIVPKLHKLSTLLRGREYDDEEHDEDASSVRFRVLPEHDHSDQLPTRQRASHIRMRESSSKPVMQN